ncbi:MAG: DUF2306 domain-containing protein [Gemmatimonadetes bacterium]|uniref:DUF2306 domain-containing protein n=1 Tax=Candidatus Kutchimonas denitrificans TaxID=3056748 RepID=A0AAE5CCF5_9BACT|nr:DUF2306 domain-containing protein [Gemmatimonadota bacterium]NIR75585.1 DUF2306 domain-containing protein [Candidatus Kutchimonas denitrificans]NIS01899.1 DUF2306 domain-containing protein [Gemmatimonadota bacterium]NIT67680.1 DUF2306 domain-containing protein [Gemmatimonadota bacterium]NIU53554.1 DUF2306 domain-containing protein [Gemmatimonadota bacterium]
MRITLLIHILAGGLALIAGFVAIYAAKGATLHRKSGTLFVYAILAMALCGIVLAVGRNAAPAMNIPAAALTLYLVVTALITVRPPAAGSRPLHLGLMLVASAVSLSSLKFGVEALADGGTRKGIPAFPFFLFGVVGLLATVGDVRVIRNGALRGAGRLARHLWRMSFALFVVTMSFFIGQAQVIPRPIRIPGLLALPVLAVLITMSYWLWRVRIRGNLRSIARFSASGPDQTTSATCEAAPASHARTLGIPERI